MNMKKVTVPLQFVEYKYFGNKFKARCFNFCVGGFRAHFDIGDVEKCDLVLSTRKPRHPDYFPLEHSPDDVYWVIADCHPEDCESTWSNSFDRYLTRTFDKNRTVYATVLI